MSVISNWPLDDDGPSRGTGRGAITDTKVDLYVTKDSGSKDTFATGYQRDSREGKGRFDLLPLHALERLAKLYERGASKYGDRNFAKGAPFSRCADSAMRHLVKFMRGEIDEDHLIACCWNLMQIAEYQWAIAQGHIPAELEDLPIYPPSMPAA